MRLHDHTRRTLALLIFFLFGPMLTLSVLGGILWRKLPWAVASHERRVFEECGFRVRIGGVEHLEPGKVRYSNLRMLEPETGETVLRCPEATLAFIKTRSLQRFEAGIDDGTTWDFNGSDDFSDTGKNEKRIGLIDFFAEYLPFRKPTRGYWRVTSPEIFLHFDKIAPGTGGTQLKEHFFGVLSRRSGPNDAPLEFGIDSVQILFVPENPSQNVASISAGVSENNTLGNNTAAFSADGILELKTLCGRFLSDENSTFFNSQWTMPHFAPGETVSFAAVRSRSGSAPTTHLRFAVPANEYTFIPAMLLSPFVPSFAALGPNCRFCGTIRADQLPQASEPVATWSVRWENVWLREIDLTRPHLAPMYTAYQVTGTVDGICIRSAHFHGTLREADGWLHVCDGTIQRELFERLVSRFSLIVEPAHFAEAFPTQSIPFDHCVVAFDMQPEGVAFTPYSTEGEYGGIMRFRDGARSGGMDVFAKTRSRRVEIPLLMAALVRDETPAIPLTPGSGRVMGLLQAAPTPSAANEMTTTSDTPTTLPLPRTSPADGIR